MKKDVGMLKQEGTARWIESMQQSSATPENRDVGRGLRKIVACSQSTSQCLLCFNSFWHGVIPTSFFIFNDLSTCFTHFSQQCIGIGNDTLGKQRRSYTQLSLPSPSIAPVQRRKSESCAQHMHRWCHPY